jgi:hypothetical protein
MCAARPALGQPLHDPAVHHPLLKVAAVETPSEDSLVHLLEFGHRELSRQQRDPGGG